MSRRSSRKSKIKWNSHEGKLYRETHESLALEIARDVVRRGIHNSRVPQLVFERTGVSIKLDPCLSQLVNFMAAKIRKEAKSKNKRNWTDVPMEANCFYCNRSLLWPMLPADLDPNFAWTFHTTDGDSIGQHVHDTPIYRQNETDEASKVVSICTWCCQRKGQMTGREFISWLTGKEAV